jgi:DNA-binding HxlR family transcriptional regulator
MPRRSFNQPCSLARTLEIVGERWSLLIVRDMWVRGPRKFEQLQRNNRIARNILTDRLETLVEGGIVERKLYQTRPDRYEYQLTETGRELVPTLLSLVSFGDRHLAGDAGPPLLIHHGDKGHPADPMVTCRHCGEELTMQDLVTEPGPGMPRRAPRAAGARRSRTTVPTGTARSAR